MSETDDTANPAGDGTPIAELASLREEPSPRFLAQVLDGINTRQTASRALEMSWWGLTGLLMELVDTLFRALGLRETSDGDSR
jgi:hypothetical protein